MSASPGIAVERPAPGVMLIAVERPEVHNAYDMATFAALEAALAEAGEDAAVRAIVITGRGGRAFSAGFDIREMAEFDAETMRNAFIARDPVMLRIAEHRCPVIAAIDGICYGAGALVALAADIRIATPAMKLKVTAVGYGGANATWSLPAVVGVARAKEILMTGRAVGADEALAIGLVTQVVPAEALEAQAVALAEAIGAHPPQGIAAIKHLVDAAAVASRAAGWQAEHDWMLANTDFGPGGDRMFDRFLSTRGSRRAADIGNDSHGDEQ